MTSSLHPLHHLWRLFPVAQRRRLLAKATALLAPKAAIPMPVADANVIIGGELGRGSGLGEGARLLLRGLLSQGVSAKGVEAGLLQSQGKEGLDSVFADPKAALVLHVNAPQTPAALLRLGRKHVLGRRIVGYWVWELPVISPEWHAGVPCVHEIWTPSHFSARALEPLMPGRSRLCLIRWRVCLRSLLNWIGRLLDGLRMQWWCWSPLVLHPVLSARTLWPL